MSLKDARAGGRVSAESLREIGRALDRVPTDGFASTFETDWFPAKITGTVAGGYTFVEQWRSGGATVDKPSGRANDSTDPAASLSSLTFATNEIALCRRGFGEGGEGWELAKCGGVTGTGTDKHVTRWNGTSAVWDSPAVLDDSGNLTTPGELYSGAPNANAFIAGSATPVLSLATNITGTTRSYNLQAYGTDIRLQIPDGQNFYLKATPTGTPSAAFGVMDASGTHTGATVTDGGMQFVGGLRVGGAFSGLTNPGDGLAGGTYS